MNQKGAQVTLGLKTAVPTWRHLRRATADVQSIRRLQPTLGRAILTPGTDQTTTIGGVCRVD